MKRTLQEIANFFGVAVVINSNNDVLMFRERPKPLKESHDWSYSGSAVLPRSFVHYSGDWRESLTLPDSWPQEPPFKDGELVFNCQMNGIMVWRDCYGTDVFRQCRHLTEEEWKILRGES